MRHSLRWLPKTAAWLLAFSMCFSPSLAQSKTPKSKQTAQSTTQPTKSATNQATTTASTAGIVDAAKPAPTLGADYIPCKFTYGELETLVTPERVLTLSPTDAEQLVQSVITEVKKQETAGLLTNDVALFVIQNLDSQRLVNLTPSQAVSAVITLLQTARAHVLAGEQLPYTVYSATQASPNTFGNPSNSNFSQTTQLPSTSTTTATPSDQQKADKVTAASGQIVSSTQETLNRLVRPPDIGCAMSVLSWDETRRAYGRIVADVYIAVQVVVRNTNQQQEFVLHDVELAVNVDPGGRVGRFFAGRDKIIVRATSSAQQNFDIRNLVVNGAQGIGAIMSAAAVVYGGAVSDAANVFNSAFLPSLQKSWKDLSVDQLNLLSDTGFSSAPNSQMVVPKNGTIMFVTFVPSKQFEQGWWTASCASRTYMGQIADRNHREMIALLPKDTVAGPLETAATGVDVQHALEFCGSEKRPDKDEKDILIGLDPDAVPRIASPSAQTASTTAAALAENQNMKNTDVYRKAATVPYKKWSGSSLAIFQELSTAVVSGMHILENSALSPTLTQFTCDTDAAGILKFPDPDKGQLTCTIKGTNIDKIKSLRLRNSKDPADPVIVDGAVALSGGDNTTGAVTFQTDAIHKLSGTDYSVMIVDSSGSEVKTNSAVHLDSGPSVTKVDPSALDESAINPPKEVTLTGYHLKGVHTLTISSDAGSVSLNADTNPAPTDSTVGFELSNVDFTKLGSAASLKLVIHLADATAKPVQLSQTLPFTPKKAAPSTPKKTTQSAPKKTNGTKSGPKK